MYDDSELRMCEIADEAVEEAKELEESTNLQQFRQFFAYAHLPAALQEVSKPFGELAELLITTLPANRERDKALDNLLAAKDCAVRARLIANLVKP